MSSSHIKKSVNREKEMVVNTPEHPEQVCVQVQVSGSRSLIAVMHRVLGPPEHYPSA